MSLKPVTFQGAENFKANLYALEVRSRFVDQSKTDGYYAGYGNELSATVASNTIKIGSGAFVVQGRMCEVENSESVSVVIENGKYGVIIARIETKPATNGVNFSIIARTGVSKDALKAALTQEDTYQYSAETTNKVYELPLYYFSMTNGAIALGAKEITAIKEITDINNAAKNAVNIAQTASATASAASKMAGEAKTAAGALPQHLYCHYIMIDKHKVFRATFQIVSILAELTDDDVYQRIKDGSPSGYPLPGVGGYYVYSNAIYTLTGVSNSGASLFFRYNRYTGATNNNDAYGYIDKSELTIYKKPVTIY